MDQLVKKYQRSRDLKSWMLNQASASNRNKNEIKPTEQWSINQLLFHLYNVEKSVLGYIQHKHQKGELIHKVGIKAKISYFSLKIMLKTNLKFKAPKVVEQNPETMDFDTLVNDWEASQNEFKAFLTNFPAELKGIAVFRHPYAGFLSIQQTIEFIIDHAEHHKRQMKRLV